MAETSIKENTLSFRYAQKDDVALISKFIKELARYEKLEKKLWQPNSFWTNGRYTGFLEIH